jgi:hypothetical protein
VGLLVIGGVAAAVTLTGPKHSDAPPSAPSSHASTTPDTTPGTTPGMPSFTVVANVTPPVAATDCTTPSAFAYSGTLSATAPGTVTYQWVYSSGQPGPVRTMDFTAAGQQKVTGETVTTKTAGSGWGEIKVISPVARVSGKAAYKLLCGGSSAGGVTVTAAVTPAAQTATCSTGAPSFTATGSIAVTAAETVSYYWAQSNGKDSAPATLAFTGPGSKPAAPLTITPPRASGAGEAVLVVTSPVSAASVPATYMLTCKAPAATATPHPTSPVRTPTSASNPPNPATPGSNTSGPGSNPSTPRASNPVTPPTTSPPSSPPPENPGSLAISNPLSETVLLGDYIDIGANANGGAPPYTWTESGLPSWAPATSGGFDQGGYSILGTGNAAGTYPFTVTLSDSAGDSVTGHYTLTVLSPNSEHWSVAPMSSTQAVVGTPFADGFGVNGQTSGLTVTWAITAGSLPPGISLNPATGAVTGTPTQQGGFNFTIVATDVATGASKQGGTYNFTVYPAGTVI